MDNMKVSNTKPKIRKRCMYILMAVFSIGQLFPLVWLIDFSLCKSGDLFGANILKWPDPPQWQNYVTAWVDGQIFKFLINSLIVNIAAGFFTVLFSLMMGYALTRMEWKLRKRTFAFILLGLMIPIHATLLPNYKTFEFVGISDSYLALIIPYIAFSLPLGVFLMTGFMETIPRSIEEAAVIDGCGIIRIVFSIILPMVKPAVMTISIMTILNTWNEFIMAATYLSSDTYRTLPFAVYYFAGQYASNYSVQFAVMNLVALPSLLVYIVLNEHITKGATAGAIKS
ncbi:MAG TPA: carbohydrate ABC transporter permease [Clostridia bacterium]|nr:carbohydrate ABC transporter permease [Clostridia bacterium]